MADKSDDDDDILKEAKAAFEAAQDAERHNRETAINDITFARLGEQWPAEIVKQREIEKRPVLTINKLMAFIRQVVNDSRQNKPSMKVHPADSKADPQTAQVIDGLLRNIEYTSNADVAYDTAVECAVSGGFGYWRVKTDYAHDDSFDMDILIERVANPFSVYGDPNSRAADSSDWNVAFVTDRLTEDQFKAEYGDKAKVDWDDDAWGGLLTTDWRDEDTVLVAEYWTREEFDKEIVITTDGAIYPPDDEDLIQALELGLTTIKQRRTTKSHKVTQRIMTGLEVLKTTEWEGRYIPIIPVYGDEFDIEGKRYFRSLIHNAVDAQRMFNYWRTAATELVALAPKVPFIGPKGAFDTDSDRWNTANTKSHPFLEYDGPVPPQRQPMDMGVAAGALQEALNASDDMKAIIGLYDASLGARSNETSGKAIMARQREGDVATFHFIDNLSRAIRHTGRIMIDLIPKVYNAERIIRVLGEDGKPEVKPVNQQYPQTDPKTGQPMMQPQMGPNGQPMQDQMGNPIMAPIMALHDLRAGKYDLTVKTGPSFTTRREEAAEQMTAIIQAFPAVAPIVMPELAKNLDWPGADKISEKIEKQAEGAVPPQVQKQMQDMQQKLQQATEENQSLKTDQSVEQAKMQAQQQNDMAKIEAQKQLNQQKADDDFAIAQKKLENDVILAQQKMNIDHEMGMVKAGHDRDAEALKNGGVEEIGPDGKKKIKTGTDVVMGGLEQLAKIIVQQGQSTEQSIERLAQLVAAPNEIVRDPKTNRATGSRKVLN